MSDTYEIDDLKLSYEKHEAGYNELKERIMEWYVKSDSFRMPSRADSISVTSCKRRDAVLKRKTAELKLKQMRERKGLERFRIKSKCKKFKPKLNRPN